MPERIKMKSRDIDAMRDEITGLFEDAYTAFEERRLHKEYENASFYRGWQHEITGQDALESSLYEDEALETANYVRPIVNAAIAATLQQIPNPEMASTKGDVKSRARAQATEMLCRAFVHNGVLDWEELVRAVSWSKQVGLGFIKVAWDPDAGREIQPEEPDDFQFLYDDPDDPDAEAGDDEWVESEDEEEVDIFGEPVRERLFEGDICTKFVPSTDGFPNPDARCSAEIRHFFHVRLMATGELLNEYPRDVYGKKLNHGSFDTGERFQSTGDFRALQQDDDSWADSAFEQDNVLAQVVEFWEMPSQRYPNGRFCVFSANTLLELGPNPRKPACIPFVPIFGDNVIPGGLYPDGLIEDLKSPQRTANRVAIKMREHLDRVANNHIFVPIGSGIDRNTWGQKPGQIIRFQKGYMPQVMELPPMPNEWFQHKISMSEDMTQISGYHDMTRGLMEHNLTGRAMIIAQEQQMAQREPIMMLFRKSMIRIFQLCIWLAREKYEDGRMVRVLGENHKYEWMEFYSDDYDFDNDLVPEVWSSEPASPALKQIQILENFEAGLYDDNPAAERARKLLGGGRDNASFDEYQGDREQARRENLILARGWPIPLEVMPEEHHPSHIEEHRSFLVTEEGKSLPPAVQEALREHIATHEYEDMMAMEDFAMQQQMLAGGDQFALPEGPSIDGTQPLDGGNAPMEQPGMPEVLTGLPE